MKLYLDGVEIASADVFGPVDQSDFIDIGVGGQPNGGNYWDGRIDDVRIAQRPYSALEIQALASVGGGGNTSPLAVADTYSGFTDEELSVSVAAGVLANDSDVDGDAFVARLEADVNNGVLLFSTDGSFTYTPDSGFIGTDSFSYVANDGVSDSGVATVTLTIELPPNEAPVSVADVYAATVDTALTVDAVTGVLVNDTDADIDDALTAALVADVSNGVLSLSVDGSFVYTPSTSFTGTDTFSYRANDGRDDSDVAIVTLQVNSATNQVPLALADSYNVEYETELSVDEISGLLANDTDADVNDVLICLLYTSPSPRDRG